MFRAILALKQRIDAEVLPNFSARRLVTAQVLMRHLYAQPVLDVKKAAKITGTTINTVSSLIGDFVSHKVLTEVTGQRRNRLFVFQEYLTLFRK
jgi:Fic family protein